MIVELLRPQDMAQWEHYVYRNPRTVAWQSYRWADVIKHNYDADFYPLAVIRRGTIRGILPLYHVRRPHHVAELISVPYAVAGGLTADDPESTRILLEEAKNLARGLGAERITLKQYRYPIDADLRADLGYFNRELDLTADIQSIFEQLDPLNQACLRSAETRNLTLVYPWMDLDDYYEMLMRDMKRAGMPCPARQWIETLIEMKLYHLAGIRTDSTPTAATLVKTFKRTISFPFTCMRSASEEDREAVYCLYWSLLCHFKDNGYKVFHSGRIPASKDVPQYRLGWGGVQHQYYYQYHPNNQLKTEYHVKRSWKRQIFSSCWKHLPESLVEKVGPKVVARFP